MRTCTVLVLVLCLAACHSAPPAASPRPGRAPTSIAEAESAWRAACPVAGIDGLCVERVAAPAGGRCGPASAERLRPVPRGPGAKAALAYAENADAGAEGFAARRIVAEARSEAFLAVEFPDDLDFAADQDGASARVTAWIDDGNAAFVAARDAWRAAGEAGLDQPERALARAREAQLYDHYALVLRLATWPRDVAANADARAAFCAALGEQATTFVAQAEVLRGACVDEHAGAADICAARLETVEP